MCAIRQAFRHVTLNSPEWCFQLDLAIRLVANIKIWDLFNLSVHLCTCLQLGLLYIINTHNKKKYIYILIKIINKNQSYFIKGRYISDNIRSLLEVIDLAEEEKIVGKKWNPNRKLTEMSRTGNLLLLISSLILRCFSETFSFIVYFYILETHRL